MILLVTKLRDIKIYETADHLLLTHINFIQIRDRDLGLVSMPRLLTRLSRHKSSYNEVTWCIHTIKVVFIYQKKISERKIESETSRQFKKLANHLDIELLKEPKELVHTCS